MEYVKVLRVVVAENGFPQFSSIDRYYDIHVHTVAEQTTWGVGDTDSARKAFGGPIVRLPAGPESG